MESNLDTVYLEVVDVVNVVIPLFCVGRCVLLPWSLQSIL